MISWQDSWSRAGFELLMVKSLTFSVPFVNIYWQQLLDSLLVHLVALDSQLVPLESAEAQLVFLEGRLFWSIPRRSGWQNVHSTASIPAGKADSTGNSTKHRNSRQDAVMADKGREISKGSKSPACVAHKPDGATFWNFGINSSLPQAISLQKQNTFGICLWPF